MADDINQLRDKLREALWGNEAFTIGILQTVAGGAIFGIFSLGDERSGWAELLAAIVITLLGAALLFAIWAALFRHKYMMWNLKALVAKTPQEAKERPQWANNNLDRMRWSITASTVAMTAAFAVLLAGLWLGYAGAF